MFPAMVRNTRIGFAPLERGGVFWVPVFYKHFVPTGTRTLVRSCLKTKELDLYNTETAQRGFQQQRRERSTKIHEITLIRNFVFVRVISWDRAPSRNLAQNTRNQTLVLQRTEPIPSDHPV